MIEDLLLVACFLFSICIVAIMVIVLIHLFGAAVAIAALGIIVIAINSMTERLKDIFN